MEPLTSAFQKSAKDSGKPNGRPEQAVVSDVGEKSRDYKDLKPDEVG